MNAEQLAAYFDNADGSVPDAEVAAMLRKQDAAINQLERENAELRKEISEQALQKLSDFNQENGL